MWTAFAPVTVSVIHCCIPFHQHRIQCSKVYAESLVTVFCIKKCTPLHRSHFFYPELHTVSSVMVSKPFQHSRFPVPTVEYSFTSHGLQNPRLYTALPVSYQHPQLHTVWAVSCSAVWPVIIFTIQNYSEQYSEPKTVHHYMSRISGSTAVYHFYNQF